MSKMASSLARSLSDKRRKGMLGKKVQKELSGLGMEPRTSQLGLLIDRVITLFRMLAERQWSYLGRHGRQTAVATLRPQAALQCR